MIFKNVEFHNIDEVQEQWNGSFQLQRVPETVRLALNDGAQNRSLAAANAEIRFTADGPVRITLSNNQNTHFHLAHGTFLSGTAYPITATPLTYELDIPEKLRALDPRHTENLPFNPRVYRILLPKTIVNFFRIEGQNIRPPEAGETPALRYLAYGTSITEGAAATQPHLAYAAQTARLLDADLVNLGMSGSCQAEKEMADYIASRRDWKIASLALSVNMMGGFSVAEFRERVKYTVDTVAGSDPTRPVACITLYPYFNGLCTGTEYEQAAEKAEAFRQTLREVVAECPHGNAHLIEGPEILDRTDGLSVDLIHPSDFGMRRMAENLAARLQTLL